MKLYDNAFSPFARKARMVLDLKGLDYEAIDGLDKSNGEALAAVNGRVEVPRTGSVLYLTPIARRYKVKN